MTPVTQSENVSANSVLHELPGKGKYDGTPKRVTLERLLAEGTLTLIYAVGEQVMWREIWFVMAKVQLPYIVLEHQKAVKDAAPGTRHFELGDGFTFKGCHLEVVKIQKPYMVLEIKGITDKLARKVAQGEVKKARLARVKHGRR